MSHSLEAGNKFIQKCHLKVDGQLRCIPSSIAVEFRRNWFISANSRWLCGANSRVKLWTDKWLGYTIMDREQIPVAARKFFQHPISKYFLDGKWYIENNFVISYPDIVDAILEYD